MRLLLYENRLKAPLKEMPDSLVPPIVRLGKETIELAHATGQISLRRLDQQMVVIVHHTVGMAQPPEAIDHVAKYCQKSLPVNLIVNDRLSGIPAARDVIDRPGKFETQRA
jgi:hypothetical protein